MAWGSDLPVRVDVGDQGRQADAPLAQLALPDQKPRKSQKNPQAAGSAAQQAVKTALSHIRIGVEQAIGGMKRYTIVVQSVRNRTEHLEDDAMGVCAGLWNLVLSY
jgi:DDE superfamily endonuclease